MAAMTTQSEAQRRAIARALARGGASAVKRVRYGLYRVESNSRPGLRHTVSVDSQGLYHCDCEAGLVGRPCWHAGAVYIAKVEHGSGRVTGPAVPLAPVGAGVA
ncbi:MAG: hypothetical protein ACRDI2_08240, partial [Chloroflexota bacterium]